MRQDPPMADWCNTFLVLICQRAHSKPSTHFLTNAFLIQAAPSFTDPSALYFVKLMLTVFLLATSLYLSNLRPSYFFAQSAVVFHYGFHSRICRIFDKWIPDLLFIAMMTRGRDEVISGLCDKLRKRRKRNQSLDFYHLTLSTIIKKMTFTKLISLVNEDEVRIKYSRKGNYETGKPKKEKTEVK